jgi:uncharacterized protein YggU (UPF0235/DUF167 family)
LILELHVQPGAARSEFAGRHGDRIKVRLAGLKSRRKRVVIEGAGEWKKSKA